MMDILRLWDVFTVYTCLARAHIQSLKSSWIVHAEAEVEPRLKFKPRLNYGWFHSIKNVFNLLSFKQSLNWNRFLADLRRGSSSLNSDTEEMILRIGFSQYLPLKDINLQSFLFCLRTY